MKLSTKADKAGGSRTNSNGLLFEYLNSMKKHYDIKVKTKLYEIVVFKGKNTEFVRPKSLFSYMYSKNEVDKNINKGHGCKIPDDCFVNEYNKQIFIIEKKFQQVAGSVCEKIQTPDFKIWQYSRTFPGYDITYIYFLSPWFKRNCVAELEYLEFKNIKYFFPETDNISNFIDFICGTNII